MSAIYTMLGELTLYQLFADRLGTNQRIRHLVSEYTEGWGVNVKGIEIRDIRVPASMQRVMAAVAGSTMRTIPQPLAKSLRGSGPSALY